MSLFVRNLPLGYRLHNRYRIDGDLGGGVNGHVYQAWDEIQQQTVALKLLITQPPSGWWIEAELLTALRGDYLLPILNADVEAGVPFIVTEVMSNGSTSAFMVKGIGVEPARAARWIQQASIGVARMHDHHLLHTDIKPDNLFLDGDDKVLVGDLGLAVKWDALGRGHAAGSPETMAPEVALAGPTTVRSDVYSLGASLYQLLAGDWLNPSLRALTDRPAILSAVASHVPRPLGDVAPHVSIGLRSIVMKAISPLPADRYGSATELAAALGARTLPKRTWRRDVACLGHTMCFTGSKVGASTIKVCVVPAGSRGRHQVQTKRIPANTRINPWFEVAPADMSRKVRAHLASMK